MKQNRTSAGIRPPGKAVMLICVPSAVALLLMFAKGNIRSLVFAAIAGLIIGAVGLVYLEKAKSQVSRMEFLISLFVGVLICCAGCRRFYGTWIISADTVRMIVRKVFADYSQGLIVIGFIAAAAALPAAALLANIFLHYILRVFKTIDYKLIWKSLTGNVSAGSVLKRTGITAIQLVMAVFLGAILMVGAYMLPTDNIESNVEESAYVIQDEGAFPVVFSWATSKQGNWVDSLMMLSAANDPVDGAIRDAMNIPRGKVGAYYPADTIVEHYVNKKPFDTTLTYARYWNGYLIFLKPLLVFMDYRMIRVLNGVLQALLVLLTCVLLIRKGHRLAVIPYILSYLMLMPIVMIRCLQFSGCFYIFTVGSIVLLMSDEMRSRRSHVFFLGCGIATSYFDLLTLPITTFGVPALFLFLIMGSESAESKICEMIRGGFFWCIGYAGMWTSKWILASVITGKNVIADGLKALLIRTSNESELSDAKFNILLCEQNNYEAFLYTPVTILAIAAFVYLVIRICKGNALPFETGARIIIPFALIGLAPVVWYAFALNHSMIHVHFTNKTCVVSFIAVFFALVCLYECGRSDGRRPSR